MYYRGRSLSGSDNAGRSLRPDKALSGLIGFGQFFRQTTATLTNIVPVDTPGFKRLNLAVHHGNELTFRDELNWRDPHLVLDVRAQYGLDFDEAEGDEADDEGEGDGDENEGKGDDVGSEDSDEESGSSEAGSVADFLDNAAEQNDDMGDYSDADSEGEENDEDAEAEAANMAQFAEAMDDDM
ncbi:hypothetical protein DFH09DRAFT_1075544 [Mycena vulgaris]|nr:hypothetical protein DFH09DRAFT_1075544 [Mycena vulgaris]